MFSADERFNGVVAQMLSNAARLLELRDYPLSLLRTFTGQYTEPNPQVLHEACRLAGQATGLACRCGGVVYRLDLPALERERVRREMGRPRYSRRRRQAKKNRKIWVQRVTCEASMLWRIRLFPLLYICSECGTVDSYSSILGRNMLRVEPLPMPSALLYYKDAENEG